MGEQDLLEKVLLERGFDPKAYRSTFLLRHVESRIKRLGLPSMNRYSLLLKRNDEEFHHLLGSLSINVTSFFRDPQTFQTLENVVIPRLLKREPEKSLRIWSAGCATGQEPYSIAMLVWQAFKRARYAAGAHIYATDVNEKALQNAKKGEFSAGEMEGVKPRLLEEFFDFDGKKYAVKLFVRKGVHFLKHDLLTGRIFPQIDVVFCRNVLIYLEKGAQTTLLSRFSESLVPGGYLFVGGSEVLPPEATRLFQPANLKARLYQKPV